MTKSLLLLWVVLPGASRALAFEGRIIATLMRGDEVQTCLYAVAISSTGTPLSTSRNICSY